VLVQAWHFTGVLSGSAALGAKQSTAVQDLVKAARSNLEQPTFRNASVKAFLKLDEVQQTLHPKKDSNH
jgi:hypothetical protein